MIESDAHALEHATERRLVGAFGIVVVFMVVEAVGGWLSGSLALLADAGHMLTDALALALSFAGFWFGRRPADARRSYGYRRFEVLAAWVNGILLSAIALWIMVEAAMRILSPNAVAAGPMLAVAGIGLLVNVFTLWLLQHGPSDHINLRGAIVHVIGDLLGSCAAVTAAIVILTTGWTPIDPLLSLLIALLILRSAAALVRSATHILLEGTPDEIDIERMREEVARDIPAVTSIHHVHAWSLSSGRPMLTLHASLAAGADRDEALRAIKEKLSMSFNITHSVIQIECDPCPDAVHPAGTHVHGVAVAVAALTLGLLATPAIAAASFPGLFHSEFHPDSARERVAAVWSADSSTSGTGQTCGRISCASD